MKIICIYHSIDLDGWMSAAIVKHWYLNSENKQGQSVCDYGNPTRTNNRLDMLGWNYGDSIPDLSEYDKVIMCDISFPKEEMQSIQKRIGSNFIWIDHHISAMKEVQELFPVGNGWLDAKFAACELTWKYFFSNPIVKFGEVEEQEPMPEIVRLLGRYDCFGHKGTEEEQYILEFQYGARQCISNYQEAYEQLINNIEDTEHSSTLQVIWGNGKSIYKYLCTEAKQSYKNGFEVLFFENSDGEKTIEEERKKFICINKERFNPINFGIDYHKDGYDGCACFYYDNKMWNFSLYNDNGEVDVSLIAKQFRGGGHKGAAGFRLTDEEFFYFIKLHKNETT
jgi:oligoribonuclease NrnB/cAMP/cGMP phosphodiesterase (DHH superfamily)